MPWTVAAEPTGTWSGRCSQVDLFPPETPIAPDDQDPVSAYDAGDLHLLEGFELPAAAVADGATSVYSVDKEGGSTYGISLSTDVRDTAVTGGHALRIVSDTTHSGTLSMGKAFFSPTYQYFRVYVKVESYTNGNGSLRISRVGGWVDSTGYRSVINFVFPASGGLKFGAENAVAGISTGATGTTEVVVGTWYRLELVTETVAPGQKHTLYVYEGDETELVETITFTHTGIAAGGFAGVGTGTTNTGNAITYLVDDVRIQTSHETLTEYASGPIKGPGGIWAMYPIDGESNIGEWTPLSGDNYANVDEMPLAAPDDETSYITSSGTSEVDDVYKVDFYPDTIPTNRWIKAITVNARTRAVAGINTPVTQLLYQDVLEEYHVGKSSAYSGTTYIVWPGSNVAPYVFMEYTTGLNTVYAALQRIGVRRPSTSPSVASRVTTLWGQMDIAPTIGEA